MIKYLALTDARFDVMLESNKFSPQQIVVYYKLLQLEELIGHGDMKNLLTSLNGLSPVWESHFGNFNAENNHAGEFQIALIDWVQTACRRSRFNHDDVEREIIALLRLTW